MATSITSAGVGSGLDVEGIISRLMAIEQRPLTLLSQQEAGYQAKLTGYGSLSGALSAFQNSMKTAAGSVNFEARIAPSSNPAIVSASAASTAATGSYSIHVDHLAQSQVLAADGVADSSAASSTGTLTLQVGTAAAKTITVNAGNNTLAGVRDAINAANAGITATIVSDGSASPYKLVLTAAASGAANTIQVTNGLSAGELHDAIASLAEVRAADDAAFTINGVAISSASNTVTTAISGVTLSLLKDGDTTVTVSRDSAAAQSAVAAFVKAYNDLNNTISTLTAYNAATRQGGVLLGDSLARNVQTQVRTVLNQPVAGASTLTVLTQAGVSFQKDGSLALDSSKLAQVIEDSPSALSALFGVHAQSGSALLTYLGSSDATRPGNYQVNISAAATRATAIATSAPAVSTLIDGTNDGFAVSVNGTASGSLTLAHGTYTSEQLAVALRTAINGSAALTEAGISVDVSLDAGRIAIASRSYGTSSLVSGTTGSSLAALGFAGTESGAGTDVAGSFGLNGQVITVTGSGRVLSGATGSAAEGLRIEYTGTPAQAAATPSMTLALSQGYASRLNQFVTDALGSDGMIESRTDGIDASIKDVETQRATINRRLTQLEARYRAQFSALDTLVATLSQTSAFLTQQLAALPSFNSSSK